MCTKQLFAASLCNAVRKREFEILREELLNVWAFHVIRLLQLNDFEDLSCLISL